MKTISSALQAFLLANTTFNRAELITIVLPNNQVINALGRTNVTQLTYPTGLPASVTVSGTCYPWSPGDPTYPFTGSGGASAATIAMTQGQVITLTYGSGNISYSGDSIDPSGYFGQVNASSYPGNFILDIVAPVKSLIGGFVNTSGWLVAPPFYIGSGTTIGPAPVGTANLVLGVNDIAWGSNSGSWVMNINNPTFYDTQYGSWQRGAYTSTASFKLSAGSLELSGFIPESVMYPGTSTSLMQVINLGALAGAKVIIQQLYWPLGSSPSSGFSMGTMQLLIGQIGNIKSAGRSKIVCEVFDLTYILNRPFPPHLIQTACRHSFCDKGCTLSINNYRTTSYALDSSSTSLYLNLTIPARVNSTAYKYGNLLWVSSVLYMCTVEGTSGGSTPSFNSARGATTTDGGVTWTSIGSGNTNNSLPLGYIQFTAGQNMNLEGAIKTQVVSSGGLPQIQLLKPMIFPVTSTDTVKLFFGCDKTYATCKNIYNNILHFGGMPFVPNPEIAQ